MNLKSFPIVILSDAHARRKRSLFWVGRSVGRSADVFYKKKSFTLARFWPRCCSLLFVRVYTSVRTKNTGDKIIRVAIVFVTLTFFSPAMLARNIDFFCFFSEWLRAFGAITRNGIAPNGLSKDDEKEKKKKDYKFFHFFLQRDPGFYFSQNGQKLLMLASRGG